MPDFSKKPVDDQEHERPEDMVESSSELEEDAARSLEDAADSHGTLEGYYAINNEPKQAEEDIADELEQARGSKAGDKKGKSA
jgi:hypothetical protein